MARHAEERDEVGGRECIQLFFLVGGIGKKE